MQFFRNQKCQSTFLDVFKTGIFYVVELGSLFKLVCFRVHDFLSNLCSQFSEHNDNVNTQNLRLAMFPGQ